MTRTFTLPKKNGKTTTLRVHRTCERCFRDLGDATQEELQASIDGTPLPSVAEECGCGRTIEKLAIMSQHRDAINNGKWPDDQFHPTWDELGADGRDAYLQDAEYVVRAMVQLGWTKTPEALAASADHEDA